MSNRVSRRRFTPLEENCAVMALLAEDGRSNNSDFPYPSLKYRNGQYYWVFRRPGLRTVSTRIRARDVMMASAELLQARWAWTTDPRNAGKTSPHHKGGASLH